MRGADYHRGILAWLPEIWSMQQEAGVEGGEFDDENDINKSYHDLYVETLRPISGTPFARQSSRCASYCRCIQSSSNVNFEALLS